MYKIIGADQQEYGPITGDQIRQWIAEGRANGQTLAWSDGAAEWRPLAAFPEFAGVFGTTSAIPPAASGAAKPAPTPAELCARDYTVDLGSCLTRSWELVKQNFWPVVGISFLIILLVEGLNQIIGLFAGSAWNDLFSYGKTSPDGLLAMTLTTLISLPPYSVFMGGLLKYYLKLIRGEPAGLGDAFSGFGSNLGQLALLGLVQGILICLGIALCVLPGIYLSVAWYFATPLVMDRHLGYWEAMELSRQVVSKHWFLIFGLMLVFGLVACCGVIVCCIGLLVSIPVGTIALMYAYEDIFSRPAS